MGSPRIRGNALSMRVGDPATDYWADATSVVLDKDTTYEPRLDGGYAYWSEWFFTVTAVQSTAEGSLWSFLWEHAGQDVPFVYAPHGNQDPAPGEPHFTGVLQVPAPPALGGEAGQFVEYAFEIQLPIIQGPLRVTE